MQVRMVLQISSDAGPMKKRRDPALLAKLRNEIQAMRAAIERQTGAQGDTVERGRT